MRPSASWLVIALALGTAAGAAPAQGAASRYELRGTLGPYQIGAAIVCDDGRIFTAAHYFYVAHLVDLPLTGWQHLSTLELREPGGGAFHLHLVGNGPAGAAPPPNFYDAVGLEGSWSSGGRTLPVRLALDWASTGTPDRIYGDVTTESDEFFEARVRRFVAAVLRGDRRTASGIVSYPLRLYGARTGVVATPRALLARWDEVFTPTIMASLRHAVPHDMFTRDGEAALGDGEMWFGATGLARLDQGGPRRRWSG